MKHRGILATILAVSCYLASPVLAQDSAFYIGAAAGQAKAKDWCNGLSGPGISCDDTDTSWKFFLGWQFNRHFAIEGGWTDLGKVSASGPVLGIPSTASISAKGWELVGVGSIPLGEQFSVYGKAGLYRTRLKGTFVVPGVGSASANDTENDFTYGVGVRYNFTKQTGARLEWQRFDNVGSSAVGGKSDIDMWSLGIVFKF